MDKLTFKPKGAESFRMKTAGVLLAATTIATGCSIGSSTGESYRDHLKREIKGTTQLTGGDKFLREVEIDGETEEHDKQLKANGGANVRTFPGIEGMVVGIIPTGETFKQAVLTSGDGGSWIAGDCDTMPIEYDYINMPHDNEGVAIFPEVCFVNGDLAQSTDK